MPFLYHDCRPIISISENLSKKCLIVGIYREAQEAEFERQRKLLEIEKERLDLEKQRFEFHTMRVNHALKTAGEIVSLLRPDIDGPTEVMIVQTLLPDLLQLGDGKGLQLALSPSQDSSKDG
jgi:hypothetical protein